MKEEIDIEHKETYYTIEYSWVEIEAEEEIGISPGRDYTIHAIWINLRYEESEDIIMLYSDKKPANYIIDVTAKSAINLTCFEQLLDSELHK